MEKNIYDKEGQYQGAIGAVVTLISGIGVSVLVLIFVGTLGGQTYNLVEDDIDSLYGVVTDESFTGSLNTAVSLENNVIQKGSISFANSSWSDPLNIGNFSIDYSQGVVTLVDGNYDGANLLTNYTHGDQTIQTSVKSGITSGFEALEQTGNYLPIIVLAIVISLVLALVLGMSAITGGSGGRGSAL